MPHPAPPAAPARSAEAPEGGGGQPEEGGRVPGGPTAGEGKYCRCKGAASGPGPAPTRSRTARAVPSPSAELPPRVAPSPAERAAAGPAGLGGARRGRTCAPSRAGESPGEHVPRRAGGGESRGRLHCCCCCCRRGRRCLFLPPAPSPPRPGRGAPCAELGRARRSRRRAPQAAAAAATVVAAARAGKLCPFVRSAPEAAGRSVQSVPFRLRGGGGEAWGGGPARGGGDGPGAGRGAATLLRETRRGCCGSQCSGAGRGRRGGAGAAEPPEPSGRGPRTKEPERLRARAGPEPERAPLLAPPRRSGPPSRVRPSGGERGWAAGAGYPGRAPLQAASVQGAPGQPRRVKLSANFILKAVLPWGGPSDLQ